MARFRKVIVKNNFHFPDYKPSVCPAEGDPYFISPEMYKSLVAVCRCGRPRSDLHLLKCVQNQGNKYLKNANSEANEKHDNFIKLPKTSSGFVGWRNEQQPVYKQWEDSIKYVSPLWDIPGGRITTTSYEVIIIG